jgi:two-component system sensor histidine kinase/response regulator
MAKILLVEDEDVQRKATEAMLRSGGHEVLLSGNGAQALIVARDKVPDLLISDIQMPKMTGTELCQKVRESPGLEDCYTILVTAREGDAVKLDSLLAGADDFVRKPVNRDDLLARVQIGVRIRKLRRAAMDAEARAAALDRNQEALVGALDAVLRGLEESVVRLSGLDTQGALARLRAAHAEVQSSLATVVLVPPPAGGGAPPKG